MACPVYASLSSGASMPLLGFGTWQAKDEELEAALEAALEAGYRHIDTATVYENEHVIGKVLKRWFDSGKISREDIFIVTKLPIFANRPEDVEKLLSQSLEKLGLSYVDIYLIHCPLGVKIPEQGEWELDTSTDMIAVWKEMEAQVDAGRTKAIGLSNFNISQVERILKEARIAPVTNQVELHAYLQQPQLVEFLKKNNVVVTAYSPLGTPGITKFYESRGKEKIVPDIINNSVVLEVAQKHNKTGAQILLRHIVQKEIVAIPKSTNPDRIKQNISIFDFELDSDDIEKLDALDCNARIVIFDIVKGYDTHPEYPFH